jgi:hypothetical protein
LTQSSRLRIESIVVVRVVVEVRDLEGVAIVVVERVAWEEEMAADEAAGLVKGAEGKGWAAEVVGWWAAEAVTREAEAVHRASAVAL